MMLVNNSIDYYFNRQIAKLYGIPSALIVNRIIWSLNIHAESPKDYEKRFYHQGRWWMTASYETFARHFAGVLTERNIRAHIRKLEEDGLVLSGNFSARSGDQTKFYSVDEQRLSTVLAENDRCQEMTGGKNCQGGWQKMTGTLAKSVNSSSVKSHNKVLIDIAPPDGVVPLSAQFSSKCTQAQTQLAEQWVDHALETQPWQKGRFKVDKFADAIRKMQNNLKFTDEQMAAVLEFIKQDDFWFDKALSPASLMAKSKNGLRKIDNLLNSMRPKSVRQEQKMQATMDSLADIRWED